MTRNDIIAAINDMFDENTELKTKNKYLEKIFDEHQKTKSEKEEKINPINPIDLKILEYGKEKLIEELFITWRNDVDVRRAEDSNELIITPYEEWIDKKIRYQRLPNNMSLEDVKLGLYGYIIETYASEKEKAINKFKEKEAEKKENE